MLSLVVITFVLRVATQAAEHDMCDRLSGEVCREEKEAMPDVDANTIDAHSLFQKPDIISKSVLQTDAKHVVASMSDAAGGTHHMDAGEVHGQRNHGGQTSLLTVKVHTCDIDHAGTDSHVELRVDGAGSWHDLDNWGNDMQRNHWDTYTVSGSGSYIEIQNKGSDGWCVDKMEIDGIDVTFGLPRWLDGPCTESSYGEPAIPCSTSASFTTQTTTPVPSQPDQDLLTVLTFNTYLLRVRIVVAVDTRPNLAERQALITTWFNTLQDNAVPDIVVLQEIYSAEAQDMLRAMCNPIWTKNSNVIGGGGGHPHDPYIPCTVPTSKFAYATRCVNPTSWLNPVKTGGVVVLVKKDIDLISADDIPYDDCSGEECFTVLGFWAIKLRKGTQLYWFFGTHAIAYEHQEFIEIRQKQFKQMRAYIEDHVEDEARIAIAGDMNIFTGPYKDEANKTHVPDEIEPMLANLGSGNAPAIGGDHVPTGFWLPLDSPMNVSADPDLNHVIHAIPSEARLGHQRFDWVIAPGPGDRLATPKNMRYQIVPVKSDSCFVSEQSGYPEGTKTDDLSDHYGVFAEIRWTDGAPESQVVTGHRGAEATLPAGTTCTE